MPDHQSLPRAAVAVASLDVLVALLAGIAIFSVVFSQGMDPAEGPGLMFVTLPIAFAELPGGSIWLAIFFLLLLLATWTSSINLAEPMVAGLQGLGLKRGQAAAIVGVAVWSLGLLSVLSFSTMKDVDWIGGMNFFELVTTVPTDLFLPIGGLLIAIFAAWVMSRDTALRALDAGPNGFRVWQFLVRYVSIPLVVVVLASGLI
jgi:NSS family neurotransmitter:Na+ symporter